MCIVVILAFAFLLFVIADKWDMYSKKNCQEKIDSNRKAFECECERAGKDLMLHDELQKLKEKSVRFQPIRKAVGYFSNEAAQALVR